MSNVTQTPGGSIEEELGFSDQDPQVPPTTPIRPYANAKPPRRHTVRRFVRGLGRAAKVIVPSRPHVDVHVPGVVKRSGNFYAAVLRVLDPIAGAYNFGVAVALLVWAHFARLTFTSEGVAMGVALVLVELVLFAAIHKLYREATANSIKNLFLMGLTALVGLGLTAYVVYRWTDLVPSMLLVSGIFMTVPGPLVAVEDQYMQQTRDEEAQRQADAKVAREVARLNEAQRQADSVLGHLVHLSESLERTTGNALGTLDKATSHAAFVFDAAGNLKTHITNEGAQELSRQRTQLDTEAAATKQRQDAREADLARRERNLNEEVAQRVQTIHGALVAELQSLKAAHTAPSVPEQPRPSQPVASASPVFNLKDFPLTDPTQGGHDEI